MENKYYWTSAYVLGDVIAGDPEYHSEEKLEEIEINTGKYNNDGAYFALRIKGRSMEPRFFEGDVVSVRRQDNAENGDIVVISIDGEGFSVKEFIKSDDGVRFVPLNKDYDEIVYNEQESKRYNVQIIGKVIELIARL